jgi:multiple antibiotic resistance protein
MSIFDQNSYSIEYIALTLFLVADPLGNVPIFAALLKDFPVKRQKKILLRESLFSFLIAIAFLFAGENFLSALQIQNYALRVCGGTLLFIVALNMIFPPPKDRKAHPKEPFIVPIATPLITGGGLLSTILIFAQQENNIPKVFFATLIAWVGITACVVASCFFNKLLGRRGLLALEQLMGMLLALLATELIVKGITDFLKIMQLQYGV